MMQVNRSGYYAYRKNGLCQSKKEDILLTGMAKESWEQSGRIYGYRKVHQDILFQGKHCSRHRIAKLMRSAGFRAEIGYKKRRFTSSSASAICAANNVLDRQFAAESPNKAWVTDITYIRTYEGWLYLAVVLDLFSRKVVGWSMDSRMDSSLVVQALQSAVSRRRPMEPVLVHSDQGSQFTGHEWASLLRSHNLQAGMSRRGNCLDNAVVESFFQLLKREKIRRKIYKNREDARKDIFEYIEMFYNPKRRHSKTNYMSPADYEKQFISEVSDCL